ncbi:MAG: hypothetical protein KKC46_17430 [Proteobacteria bacterium]|nr:hypothetical protein [Pseudomonadota bacterium]
MKKTTMLTIALIVAALISITLMASRLNTDNYFIEYKQGAIEIWKGRFSPLGRELFIVMPGAEAPNPLKEVYTREEVFPLIAKYYIEKADAVMDVPGLPDFEGMRTYLNKSLSFAINDDLMQQANARLNKIDRMVLIYKGDIALNKDTLTELKTAHEYLKRAMLLGPDEIESDLIKRKIDFIIGRMAFLKAGLEISPENRDIPSQEIPLSDTTLPETTSQDITPPSYPDNSSPDISQ